MPKERMHLLLADESLRLLNRSGDLSLDEPSRAAYLLGSMFPDVFFYDVPTFSMASLGNALHRFQGEAGAEFLGRWIEAAGKSLAADVQSWILGLACHFLADGIWHPVIDALSRPPFPACRHLGLTSRDCHHWLEAELESHWLVRLGPPDGYIPLLKTFQKNTTWTRKYARAFREFLLRAEFIGVPSAARIGRCLFWQTFMLRQFTHPFWSRRKPRLLAMKTGRPPGALIVPGRSDLPAVLERLIPEDEAGRNLCRDAFMAQSIMTLATRLRELPARFR